ncbi:MAG TPA: hypothetical protein P5287_00870 [bacterium]|nr:hypothetical protein [bacterium]
MENVAVYFDFLVKHEAIHLIVALLLCVLVYRWYQAWSLIFLLLGITLLMDADHLFDCYKVFGGNFNIQDFVLGKYWASTSSLFVPLHSWEIVIAAWLFCWYIGRVDIGLVIALAMSGHILVDQFTYAMHPLAYSFIFRAAHGFHSLYFTAGSFLH